MEEQVYEAHEAEETALKTDKCSIYVPRSHAQKAQQSSQSSGPHVMLGDPVKLAKFSCISISGLPWWLSGNESACNAGDMGLIPGSGRSPGEGNGNPLQYSCLENPMDRGPWQARVHGFGKEWDTSQGLNKCCQRQKMIMEHTFLPEGYHTSMVSLELRETTEE